MRPEPRARWAREQGRLRHVRRDEGSLLRLARRNRWTRAGRKKLEAFEWRDASKSRVEGMPK